jgi:HEAT repeat protein
MPKLNAVLMALFAVAVIAVMAFLTLRPAPAQEIEPAQVQKLLRKLGDRDPDLRREGEAGLRELGKSAVAPLREASKSSDRVLADRAAKLLQELQPPSTPAPALAAPACSPPKPAPSLTE